VDTLRVRGIFSFQPRMTGAVTRVDENCSRKE
jgi:hypothetical protein